MNMKKWLSICLAVVLFAAMACSSDAASNDRRVLRLGHQTTETSNFHSFALRFKELVEERSGGRLYIDIFPNAQLGFDRDLVESVQFGTLDFCVNSTSPASNFIPAFMTLDFPFLFEDWDHVLRFINSDVNRQLLREGYDDGLVGLGMLARGFRQTTNSRGPLATSSDFAGLRIRVIESPIYIRTFEALGATAIAMSWGEVFTALQQGTIDAQENDYTILYEERVYEVQRFISETGHIFSFASLLTNQDLLESLPADLRAIIEEAGWEAGVKTSAEQIPLIEDYIEKLLNLGMQINPVDRSEMRAKVANVRAWFISQFGDKYLLLIEAL